VHSSRQAANMTWAKSSLSTTFHSTHVFLRRNLWIWPIIAVVVLAGVGYLVRAAIESTMRDNLRSSLQTLLDVEVAMLQTWFQVQESNVQSAANSSEVRQITQVLISPNEAAKIQTQGGAPLTVEEAHKRLERHLNPIMSSHRYSGYLLADRKKTILASSSQELVGQEEIPEFDDFLTKAMDGTSIVSAPFRSNFQLKSASGRMTTQVPVMFAASPVRDENFQVIGALCLQIRPEEEFTGILQLGRLGESGETYAFNRTGLM
ncbi:MAG: cache domain-containing protein, partial [Planctomycetaceae bacterium]